MRNSKVKYLKKIVRPKNSKNRGLCRINSSNFHRTPFILLILFPRPASPELWKNYSFSRQAYLQSTSLFTISRCLVSFSFSGALPWHAYHEWIFILLLPPAWQPLGIRVYLHGIPPRTSHRYFSSFPLSP